MQAMTGEIAGGTQAEGPGLPREPSAAKKQSAVKALPALLPFIPDMLKQKISHLQTADLQEESAFMLVHSFCCNSNLQVDCWAHLLPGFCMACADHSRLVHT